MPDYTPCFEPRTFLRLGAGHPTNDGTGRVLVRAWYDPATAEDFLRSQLARGDHPIFYCPAGRSDQGGMHSSKQFLTMEPWRVELLRRVLGEWLVAKPGRSFELFIGHEVGDPWTVHMDDARPPDPESPATLCDFLSTIAPWCSLLRPVRQPLRVWLDHSGSDKASMVQLAAWCRRHLDVQLGIEAIPHTTRGYDASVLDEVPAIALTRFFEHFDPDYQHTVPAGRECIAIWTKHPRQPEPTPEILASYTDRGVIHCSGHEAWDAMILTDPGPPPPHVGVPPRQEPRP